VKGWLLDTNVVAELTRRAFDPKVKAWADSVEESSLFISVLVVAEYDKGVSAAPVQTPDRLRYEADVRAIETRFAGRVLPLTDAIVRRWGRVSGAIKRTTGLGPPVVDILMAATAIEHDLYFAIRNVKDVANSGARVFNPWIDDPSLFPIT
jgi:predicted nucleic acid-binding protein